MIFRKNVVKIFARLWILALISTILFSQLTYAEAPSPDSTAPAVMKKEEAAKLDYRFLIPIAAGLCIAIAAFGGAIAQGKAVASALEGLARNPGVGGKLLTPMIIGLAFIESLVLYALLISFIVMGKL